MKAGGSFGLSGWLSGSRMYNTRCTLAVCSRCAYSEASGHANRCDSALAAIMGMILVFPAIFDSRHLGQMGKTPASHPGATGFESRSERVCFLAISARFSGSVASARFWLGLLLLWSVPAGCRAVGDVPVCWSCARTQLYPDFTRLLPGPRPTGCGTL